MTFEQTFENNCTKPCFYILQAEVLFLYKIGWKMETIIAPCLWPEADYWGWVIIFIIGPRSAWPGPGNGLSWDKKTRKQMPPSKPMDTASKKLFYKQTLGPSEDEARGDNFPGGRGKHC